MTHRSNTSWWGEFGNPTRDDVVDLTLCGLADVNVPSGTTSEDLITGQLLGEAVLPRRMAASVNLLWRPEEGVSLCYYGMTTSLQDGWMGHEHVWVKLLSSSSPPSTLASSHRDLGCSLTLTAWLSPWQRGFTWASQGYFFSKHTTAVQVLSYFNQLQKPTEITKT